MTRIHTALLALALAITPAAVITLAPTDATAQDGAAETTDDTKAEPKVDAKKAGPKADPKTDAKKTDPKADPKTDAKAEDSDEEMEEMSAEELEQLKALGYVE